MLARGVEPNTVTFTNLITVFKDSDVSRCEAWVEEMLARGLAPDAHNYSALIDAYVRAGQRVKAQAVFAKQLSTGPDPDSPFLFNTTMKLGPFDWAYGCFAALLALGMSSTPHTRATMHSHARDDVSDQILAILNRLGWHRIRILSCPELLTPPKGAFPSLQQVLRFTLREAKVDAAVVDRLSERLEFEIQAAKAAAAAGHFGPDGGPAAGAGRRGGHGLDEAGETEELLSHPASPP